MAKQKKLRTAEPYAPDEDVADAHMQSYLTLKHRYQNLLDWIGGDHAKIVPHAGLSWVSVAAVDSENRIIGGKMIRTLVVELRPHSWARQSDDEQALRNHYDNFASLLRTKVADIQARKGNDLGEALSKFGYGKIIVKITQFVYSHRKKLAKREEASQIVPGAPARYTKGAASSGIPSPVVQC